MFSNQVSRRDLRNSSSERNDSESFSQLQYSQYDFTQQSSGSESLLKDVRIYSEQESQGRRMFDKFGGGTVTPSKPHRGITRTGSFQAQGPQSAQNHSSFQQNLLNKVKAKERDDRDKVNDVLQTVKTCCDELKETLRVVEEGIGGVNQMICKAEEGTSVILDKTTDRIHQKFKEMLDLIKAKEDQNIKFLTLKEDISRKDATIAELQTQLEKEREKFSEHLLKSLSQMIQTSQLTTEESLQKLLTMTERQHTCQQQIFKMQEEANESSSRTVQDIPKTINKTMQKFEGSLHREFSKLRDDLDQQKEDIMRFYQTELQTMNMRQSREIEKHITQSVDKSSKQIVQREEDLGRVQGSQIQEMLQTHHESLRSCFREQVCDSMIQQVTKRLETLSNDIGRKEKSEASSVYKGAESFPSDVGKNSDKEGMNNDCNKSQDHEKKDENCKYEDKTEFCETFPPEVQAKLAAMHKKHQEEAKNLKKEMEERKGTKNERSGYSMQISEDKDGGQSTGIANSDGGISKDKSEFDCQGHQSISAFKSPGFSNNRGKISWNSRKINPSPIAEVMPVPQKSVTQRCENSQSSTGSSQRENGGQRGRSVQRRSQRLAKARNVTIPDQEIMQHDHNTDSQTQCSYYQTSFQGYETREMEGNIGNETQRSASLQERKRKLCHQEKGRESPLEMEQTYSRDSMREPSERSAYGSLQDRPRCDGQNPFDRVHTHSRGGHKTSERSEYTYTHHIPSSGAPQQRRQIPASQADHKLYRYDGRVKENVRTPAKRPPSSSVYDFRDDDFPRPENFYWIGNPRQKSQPQRGRSMMYSEPQENSENCGSSDSRDSSPSLSVTKIFIKRKQRRLPDTPSNSQFGKYKTYQKGSVISGYLPQRGNGVLRDPEDDDIAPPQKWISSQKTTEIGRSEARRYKPPGDIYEWNDEMEFSQTIQPAPKKSRYT